MGSRIRVFQLIVWTQILAIFALTDSNDFAALNALKASWDNLPPSWEGSDPCDGTWEGIQCNSTRVTSLKLAGMRVAGSGLSDISLLTELEFLDLSNNIGLRGTIPSSIGNLKKLSILILVGCNFFGSIPSSIGSLQQLVYLSLNSNKLGGQIPPSIGNLSKLSWLDLSENQLSGSIPVSNATASGLDMLVNARHFHLSNNQLSGMIHDRLFHSNMSLIHVIFDNNRLTGNIPDTLGLVKTLEVIRLDGNSLNGFVPSNLNNLTNLNELYLANNNLLGSLPNLTGMDLLYYVDLSNNSFNASEIPEWFTSLQLMTTLKMENTQLQGQIPVEFFGLPQLETVVLGNNNLSGTLDIGGNYRSNLVVDLRNNSITNFRQRTEYSMELILVQNPICNSAAEKYCTVDGRNSSFLPQNNCPPSSCSDNKMLSLKCQCSHPYTGTLHFFSFAFSDLQNLTYFRNLSETLSSVFLSNGLPIDSVLVSNPIINVESYLQFKLLIFPSGKDSFNRTSISTVGFVLNRQPPPLQGMQYYGPFFFLEDQYCCFAGKRKSSNTGIIIGVAVGSSVLVLLSLFAGIYALRQRKRAKRAIERSHPFATWDPDEGTGSVPQLKGAKWFSFEDLRKCTSNFSESYCIGSGGYGKVYKGIFASGQMVAIKRAQQGSMQGALEFKTEIELLSRIHHKNVVGLVGFCHEQGEQMLVYEYIPNGTLRDCLSGKSGIQLNWMKRLRVALDAARGLLYLHELANPPIIHRDVKSNNILLDDHLNAKVADFGLSKLMGDTGKGYVTTQVKGTLGYMDPEYYMTQQLTEKSDVYSFGVVLLELVTARAPIHQGKHIVRAVQESMTDAEDINLHQILDPRIRPGAKLGGLEKFIALAMRCVQESATDRPTMGEVVREIENIIELATMNKTTDEEFSLLNYEETTDESPLHSHASNPFDVSYGSLPFHVEHH